MVSKTGVLDGGEACHSFSTLPVVEKNDKREHFLKDLKTVKLKSNPR